MKTIVILMDSLNRHMLKSYNNETWVHTPNLDSFSEDSVVFDRHFIGSMPCMPARRDIYTGRMSFLERGWGPLEPFDVSLMQQLNANNICTHMITDHTHYVEVGGDNYLQNFKTWDIHRGQEMDQWVSLVDQPSLPDEFLGKANRQYESNRTRFVEEKDYPTPKTFQGACDWAEVNANTDDFFLMVEAFDPHEPFDTPESYTKLYSDQYDGPRFEWSTYAPVTESDEAIEHLRKKYAATLTMTDQWFGKFINSLKQNGLYEDALIIVTTDHGHMLGEHGFTGKNFMHAYNEMAVLPLMIHVPGSEYAGERRSALTQNTDLMPTILSHHAIDIPSTVKGYDLRSVIDNHVEQVRDAAIYGWHRMAVNVTDGRYTYFRAAANEDNQPLNDYCLIPTSLWQYLGLGKEEQITYGRFLPRTNYPLLKIPKVMKRGKHVEKSMLFDISQDFMQENPLEDRATEASMIKMMVSIMNELDTPNEQFVRLGLEGMTTDTD